MNSVYEYKTHIRFDDINENNQLSNKGVLNIFSEAAGVHSYLVGYSLNNIEETGYSWMLLYWKIKVIKRPRWNEEITVKTWAREFLKVSSWRDFEAYDESGDLVAIATTEWALIDVEKNSLAKIPEKLKEEYKLYPKSVFEDTITGKLKEPKNMQKIYEHTAVRRDIDANHHVNNVKYLEFSYEAFPQNMNFENLEIYYKKQVKLRRKS